MSQPALNAVFSIEADIEAPLHVTDGKSIFNVPSGKLIDFQSNGVIGELISPSGDWL